MDNINIIAEKLKELIDKNGPDYLSDKPYKVFENLVNSKTADKKTAGAIFCVLVNKLHESALNTNDIESFSYNIKKKCGFNKSVSDFTATVFVTLYSEENKADWKGKTNEGLEEFLEEEMELSWEGYSVWRYGDGGVACHYNAEIIVKPTIDIIKEKNFKKRLVENPFIKKEEIERIFRKSLKEQLDRDFEEYCTCDDYYEPVAEDFEADYYTSDWCIKNGFEMISCDGDGRTDDYEPDFHSYY